MHEVMGRGTCIGRTGGYEANGQLGSTSLSHNRDTVRARSQISFTHSQLHDLFCSFSYDSVQLIVPIIQSLLAAPHYLLFKYQLKALADVLSINGVGTSPRPGLATGCRRYTAEHMFWFTSRYLGMNAKTLI